MINNDNAKRLLELLEEFEDLIQIIPYSGRYMFGKYCIGIIIPKEINIHGIVADITAATFGDDDLLELVVSSFKQSKTDEMGRDTVIYFPHLPHPDPETEID